MTGFLKCLVYFAVTGIASFFLGRILPNSWFSYDAFPYRAFPFEKNGRIYERLEIRKWKEKLPDMSRILPKFIPSKKVPKAVTGAQVDEMLRETCVAEFIHALLCVTGYTCVLLWKSTGGWILYIAYILANIPFCLIQRYNRPKLVRIAQKLKANETVKANSRKPGETDEKLFNIELQYGART